MMKRVIVNIVVSAVCALIQPTSSTVADGKGDGGKRPQEARAGSWRTYVLTSGAEIPLSAPPRMFSHQAHLPGCGVRAHGYRWLRCASPSANIRRPFRAKSNDRESRKIWVMTRLQSLATFLLPSKVTCAYSNRSSAAGSVRAARRAGKPQATEATIASTETTSR
jgi:hypothetical protein